jgi:uncharacterized Zn finger protein
MLDENDDLSLLLLGAPHDDEVKNEEAERTPEKPGKTGSPKIRKILEGKSREELVDLLMELAAHHPVIEQSLRENDQLHRGQVAPLVRALRKEINHLTSEPSWRNHWNQEGSVPDYSHVLRQFEALFAAGHFDELVDLGDLLWREGANQVEQSDDDGETAMDISECLEVVLAAVPYSSLSRPQQLLWVIERRLADEFGLLESGDQMLEREAFTLDDWREVATAIEGRLATTPISASPNFSETHRRKELVDCLINAYQRGGQTERIQPLLEAEVDRCRNYEQLVNHLLQSGDRDCARQWCIRGFQATIEQSPGVATLLQQRLRAMAEEEKCLDLVAAYRAQDFFHHPSTDTFKELRKSMEKSALWPKVRELVLAYLESGQRPDLPGKKGAIVDWPLPRPEVAGPVDKGRGGPGGRIISLIDIAILEKRMDEVVRWYEMARTNKADSGPLGERVAQAVAKSHPDIALGIWRRAVDRLIALVKPNAYNEAAGILRLMRKVYEATGRQSEWLHLLDELRQAHKAKRRLLEVLDSLSGVSKKIPSDRT